jgi:EAL domain-containing protein (putative c-di-GMP-specific phosphodiesterase class I)
MRCITFNIDQSFICDLGDERDARAIIGAVASLGAGLDKIVVAEGIETEEQLKLLASQGCHEGQGYLFGRPMTADAIRVRLETPMTLRRWSPSIRAGQRLSQFEDPIVPK